jgi:spermidine synthase
VNASSVLLFYALSGFVSLGYQVCWFRIWVDRFGSTNLTFALVLCNFIGGLGVGALASRRLSDWMLARSKRPDRLVVYGIVELLVTVTVLGTLAVQWLPTDLWGSFPYELQDTYFDQRWGYRLTKLVLAAVCIFVPCFFMGVTFPLLCRVFVADARFPSRLYAWNTLGACSGVLACQFVLFPAIGHGDTFLVMAALNALLGLVFLLRGGARARSEVVRPAAEQRTDPVSLWIACAILSGLLAGAVEGDLFRRVRFVVSMDQSAGMAFISFWAILAIFLASVAVHRLRRLNLGAIRVAFILALLAYVTIWKIGYDLRALLEQPTIDAYVAGFPKQAHIGYMAIFFPTHISELFWVAGIFTFPTFFLVSLLLPFVCNKLQASGRHLGLAYGLNTLAFCIGVVAFTWLAPGVNVFYSMKLTVALFVILTASLFLLREGQRLAPWKPALTAVAIAAAVVWTPAEFDASYVMPNSPQAQYPIRAMRSNGALTTYVVEDPSGERLCFDNHPMSSASLSSQLYMRLMAHFPLLAHPQPKRAMLICLGVGNTGSAIAAHSSIEALDVVDLNHRVIQTISEFKPTNNGFYEDPRVRLIHDDGRNFLNVTDQRYDLITSEPPPPMMEGVYRLYSRQYYATVLEHLTEHGMMTQWLPVYQMPRGAVDLAVTTFIEAFPNTLLFTGAYEEFILVGSRKPIDLGQLARRFFEDQSVVDDLASVGVHTPEALLTRIVLTDANLRSRYAGREVIRDEHNDLARLFVNPLDPVVIDYSPQSVLAQIRDQDAQLGDRMSGILGDLGRVLYRVPDFPYASLDRACADGSDDAAAQVIGCDVDWLEVGAVLSDVRRARGRQDAVAAKQALIRALRLAPSQAALWLRLAALAVLDADIAGALEPLQRFCQLEPDEIEGAARLGEVYEKLERYVEARPLLERAVADRPDDSNLLLALSRCMYELGDHADAVQTARRAMGADPADARARVALARALVALGEVQQALEHLARARDLAPGWPAPWIESAQLLAGDPEFERHDPKRAVRFAEHAQGLRPRPSARLLSVLSMAYAADGQPEAALQAAERARAARAADQ